jgi:hypothetical protein
MSPHTAPASFLRQTAAALALIGSLLACAAAASADDEARTFISIEQSYYSATDYIDSNGKTQTGSCTFTQQATSIYAQHQMNARDSWFADTSYNNDTCGSGNTRGLTDIELGVQHGISHANPTLFSIRGAVTIPTGYDIGANPRLGLGRPGAGVGLVYLSGFQGAKDHYGFVTAAAGVRAYTSYPAPQLNTNVTAGYGFTPGFMLIESFFGTTHLGAGGELQNVGVNPIVNASYNSYQLSSNAVFSISPAVRAHFAYWNLLGGENVGIGSQVYGGLWFQLR